MADLNEGTSRDPKLDPMKELCSNCGLTYGSHHAGRQSYPYDYCPGNEGEMNWEEGPGTTFMPCRPIRIFGSIPHGTPAIGRKGVKS
jgi:hypothetical protein